MRLTLLSCSLAIALAVSACGIKPGKVEPPDTVKHDTYPHTYPNPSTDPQNR